MTIQAPYRFVPLSNLIVLPDWADKVSHDKPFKDGICGELEVTITTHGEVCVGGKQVVSSKQEAGKVEFYKTPDGKPAIPGSSLKGMLRNVLEIATFSRFKQVEDQKLGVRDISESNGFYAKEIVSKPVQSGWLRFEKNEWCIYPCNFARVHQQSIIDYFNIKMNDWEQLKSAKDRYKRLKICPLVKFEDTGDKKYLKTLANLSQNGDLEGNLVVTGQPGAVFTRKNAKKYEFIFFDHKAEALPISSKVMSEFRQIHEDSPEWKFWLAQLPQLKNGIPVFFHKDSASVVSLGLAMMYKLAYKNSIHDAINHTTAHHTNIEQPDFADLIFGYFGEGDQQGLRGRVNIGQGSLQSQDVITSWTRATILSSPKPTYYPTYIRQDKKDFNQLMENRVEVSGWKRYPIKPVEILPPSSKSQPTVQVKLETIPRDVIFSSKIRLHNLRPVELGALLWCIDFGARNDLFHGLGIGKPYGLGQVSLNVENSVLKRNNQESIQDNSVFLVACRLEFETYMNTVFKEAGLDSTWQQSGEVQALIEYAALDERALDLDYLAEPKDFANLKKKAHLDEFKKMFHKYSNSKVATNSAKLSFIYINQLSSQLEIAEAHRQIKLEQKARADQKKNASAEDMALLELEEFIALAEKEVTKTIKSKANKAFNEPFVNLWDNFNDEQKTRFKQLASKAGDLIQDKSLTKTAKKINDAN